MTQEVTRRAFLLSGAVRGRGPARMLLGLLAVAVFAWLAVVAFQVVRGITVHGWTLIGYVSLTAVVLYAMRCGAAQVYARLYHKGQAFCRAAGEVLGMLVLTAAGIIAWHKIQSGDTIIGIAIAVVVFLEIIRKGYEQYARHVCAPD